MQERGVSVDHATLNCWVLKYAPEFEKQFRRRQQPVGKSWREALDARASLLVGWRGRA